MNRVVHAVLAILIAIVLWLTVTTWLSVPPGPQTIGGPEGSVVYQGRQWAVFRVVDRPDARLIVQARSDR